MFSLRGVSSVARKVVGSSSTSSTAAQSIAQPVKSIPQFKKGTFPAKLGVSSFGTKLLGARFVHSNHQAPDFGEYRNGDGSNYRGDYEKSRNFAYFIAGGGTVAGAAVAKNMVTSFVNYMAAGKDVLALAKVEVKLTEIPEATSLSVMWRGKPLFIRHRSQAEIDDANSVDVGSLRDPENDSDRCLDPKYLIMIGVCTHLGCIPVGEAGEYGGWFCPCHGSHYDISGRIRKGPAPLNLEIPPYVFVEDNTLAIIG